MMWISSNRLKLNTNKTQYIWLGTKQHLIKVCCWTVILGGTIIPMSTEVTCLGVVLDNEVFHSHKDAVRTLFLSSSTVENNSTHYHYY